MDAELDYAHNIMYNVVRICGWEGGYYMTSVNVTVRLDEQVKKEFDCFCDNVGINITTAFTMFIKATLRTRALPFAVTDMQTRSNARQELRAVFREMQDQSVVNGTDNMTLDEINSIIAESRRERQENAQ